MTDSNAEFESPSTHHKEVNVRDTHAMFSGNARPIDPYNGNSYDYY